MDTNPRIRRKQKILQQCAWVASEQKERKTGGEEERGEEREMEGVSERGRGRKRDIKRGRTSM